MSINSEIRASIMNLEQTHALFSLAADFHHKTTYFHYQAAAEFCGVQRKEKIFQKQKTDHRKIEKKSGGSVIIPSSPMIFSCFQRTIAFEQDIQKMCKKPILTYPTCLQ